MSDAEILAQGKLPSLVIEKPDGKVHRQATFYPMMGMVLDHHLQFEKVDDLPWFPSFRDPEWKLNNADHFKPQSLPKEMSAHWKHTFLKMDLDEVAPQVSDLKINKNELIEHLPDIGGWLLFQIVSERAREELEAIDPDISYFLPLNIYDQQDRKIEKTFYWWVARHRIDYLNNALGRSTLGVPFPGPFNDPGMVFEMKNDPVVREYLAQLPFWGRGLDFRKCCFNKETFERLRAAKLAGLVENTEAQFAADRKIHESIGHI